MTEKMSVAENLAIVLPSLDPDAKFDKVVENLISNGIKHIVIVDDGSDENHKEHFKKASEHPECTVLVHEVNKGKGKALKDAFAYVAEKMPEIKGVITIDGDGQHLTKDIINCGEKMLEYGDKVVLGSRDFNQENVPARSVAGNKTTAKAFKLLFGIDINDTQTGLRAIPAQYLKMFSEFEGDRFEYETNMLLQMKKNGIEFVEVPIETVYDEEDYSSHYDGFKDSLKVIKVMLKYAFQTTAFKYLVSSALSWIIDNGIYYLLLNLFGMTYRAIFQAIGTFLSSFINFNLNKYYVFGTEGQYGKEILKYYAICVPRTLISILVTYCIQNVLRVSVPSVATGIKIVVDLILLIASYYFQKKFVFKDKNK